MDTHEKFYTYGEEPDDKISKVTWGTSLEEDQKLHAADRVFKTKAEAEMVHAERFGL